MTDHATPRKPLRPIAACLLLAMLGASAGDAFAADQRNKSPNAAAEAKHIERMQKARQQKESQARPRALPKLQQVRPDAPKQRAIAQFDGGARMTAEQAPQLRPDQPRSAAPQGKESRSERAEEKHKAQMEAARKKRIQQLHAEWVRTDASNKRLMPQVLGRHAGRVGSAYDGSSEASTQSVENAATRMNPAVVARLEKILQNHRLVGSQHKISMWSSEPSIFDAVPDFDEDDDAVAPLEMSFGPSQHAERADVQASSLQAAHAPLDMSFGPSQHAVDQDLVPKPIPGPAAAVLLALGAMDNGAVPDSQRDAINEAIDAICTNPPAAESLGEAWRTSLKLGFDHVKVDTVEDGGVDVEEINGIIELARLEDRRGNATKVLRFKPGIAYDDLPDHDQIFIAVLRADEGTGYRVVYPNWGDQGDGPGIAFGALDDQGDPEITIPEAGPELPHLKRQALAGKVAYVLYQPLEGAE